MLERLLKELRIRRNKAVFGGQRLSSPLIPQCCRLASSTAAVLLLVALRSRPFPESRDPAGDRCLHDWASPPAPTPTGSPIGGIEIILACDPDECEQGVTTD